MIMERRTLEASKRKGHRLVLLPELVHELLEGHERRVKLDPQRLGVIADGEVGGHRRRAACVAHYRGQHPREGREALLGVPESSEREGGRLPP